MDIEFSSDEKPYGGGKSSICFHHLWRLLFNNEGAKKKK